MKFKSFLLFGLGVFFTLPSLGARHWQRLTVPGATCGDGSPYNIFLSRGASDKIAFKLSGGNACWNELTCFGPRPVANMKEVTRVPSEGGFISDKSNQSPVAGYTLVYLPYCTGDVHLGNHKTQYGEFSANHTGLTNVQSSIEFLQRYINYEKAQKVVMYGNSAGAIGALYHINTLAHYLHPRAKKYLVLDAPGLHFGKNFWKKFSTGQIIDYTFALAEIGITLDMDNGLIAQAVPNICQMHLDWQVGVLQGSQDYVMSLIFGAISLADHEKLVFSSQGVYQLTLNPSDNCSAWIPRGRTHTFLAKKESLGIVSEGKKAIDYAKDLVNDRGGSNYGN